MRCGHRIVRRGGAFEQARPLRSTDPPRPGCAAIRGNSSQNKAPPSPECDWPTAGRCPQRVWCCAQNLLIAREMGFNSPKPCGAVLPSSSQSGSSVLFLAQSVRAVFGSIDGVPGLVRSHAQLAAKRPHWHVGDLSPRWIGRSAGNELRSRSLLVEGDPSHEYRCAGLTSWPGNERLSLRDRLCGVSS
jgi:hypothetical protein